MSSKAVGVQKRKCCLHPLLQSQSELRGSFDMQNSSCSQCLRYGQSSVPVICKGFILLLQCIIELGDV